MKAADSSFIDYLMTPCQLHSSRMQKKRYHIYSVSGWMGENIKQGWMGENTKQVFSTWVGPLATVTQAAKCFKTCLSQLCRVSLSQTNFADNPCRLNRYSVLKMRQRSRYSDSAAVRRETWCFSDRASCISYILTLRLLMSFIYMELLVKPEMLTSYIYGPKSGNAETISFYLLHNVSTLNQCREVSCVTFVCKHFAS